MQSCVSRSQIFNNSAKNSVNSEPVNVNINTDSTNDTNKLTYPLSSKIHRLCDCDHFKVKSGADRLAFVQS